MTDVVAARDFLNGLAVIASHGGLVPLASGQLRSGAIVTPRALARCCPSLHFCTSGLVLLD
jgi:hypothetical protein